MFNFAEIVASVIVTIINVVNTIVQTATGGQGSLAETFQSFTDTVNISLGGGGDDHDGFARSGRPAGPSAEELRLLEQERQASEFDKDIEQQRGRAAADYAPDSADTEPRLTDVAASMGLDINQWMQGEPMDAVLTVLTATNPVTFTMFQILRHEYGLWQATRSKTDSSEEAIVALCGTAVPGSEDVSECSRIIDSVNLPFMPIFYGAGFFQPPIPTIGPFGTNTPMPTPAPFWTNTPIPSNTPEGITLDFANLLEVFSPQDFIYLNIEGEQENLAGDNLAAYETLLDVLNPEGPYAGAWWFEDERVTVDEILAIVVHHEGQVDPAVQQVIFARHLFYMGGNNFWGPSDNADTNMVMSRFIRSLSYYQPWKETDVDFDTDAARSSLYTVHRFLSNPDEFIPGASNWDVNKYDPISSNRGVAGWGMLGQTTLNGQPVIENDEGELVPVVDWANTPWHFVNEGDDGVPSHLISQRLRTASVGPGPNQVYQRSTESGRTIFVLTPAQAANFCDTAPDGFVFRTQDCSKA